MTDRIHLVVREEEKERYRRSAEEAGLTLSEWLREAAREKLASNAQAGRIKTVEDLDAFFAECDSRHQGEGREPDWEDHKKVIEASIRSGTVGAEEA
ncbi:MAG: plasmid mobilization protein [Gemmatimonadota bacterium]